MATQTRTSTPSTRQGSLRRPRKQPSSDGSLKSQRRQKTPTPERSPEHNAQEPAAVGRTPFAPGAGDNTAASYLTHCYEQLMKDSASAGSSNAEIPAPRTRTTPPAGGAAAPGRPLRASTIDEPQTYVFIFTNPRSGNQQGRNLMNMALHSFRLRERPEVQVQIYDITDKDNVDEGFHYVHQLQLRQGDRLLKAAFPELFDECHGIRPTPSMPRCPRRSGGARSGSSVSRKGKVAEETAEAAAGSEHSSVGRDPGSGGNVLPNGASSESSGSSSPGAWEEWIADAAAQLHSGLAQYSDEEITRRLEDAQDSAMKLHVWSAGGDGTVSSALEGMMAFGIDVGRLYFSSIPFGTGNDFADALGWGRSVPGDGVGESMKMLNRIITERLDGYTCKLDIYEVAITTYDDGYIKHVAKDMFEKPGMKRYTCPMIIYFSLGVQGFVGSSFELHRPGSRSLNILMYTVAAAKWVFMKKFPPINEALESISTVPDEIMNNPKLTDADKAKWLEEASEAERKQVLLARVAGPRKRSHGRKMKWAKEPKAQRTAKARDFGEGVDEDLPVIQYKPIEIDIQNVARFWGRDIDVWNNAHEDDEKTRNRLLSSTSGAADSSKWTPQYAGDGKLELFGVRNISDYAMNQLPSRKSYRVSRLAQMGSPVAMHFREPGNYPPRSSMPLTSRKSIEQGLLYAMCDGEFIEIYHPKDIIVSRKVTLKAIGRSPEASRIVLDTIKNDGLDAVQMDATAAANKTRLGHPVDITNYVASPFQRIFGMSSSSSRTSPTAKPGSGVSQLGQSGSVLQVRPNEAALSDDGRPSLLSRASSSRRSAFRSLRSSIIRGVRNSAHLGDIKDEGEEDPETPEDSRPQQLKATRSQGIPRAAVHNESPLKIRQSFSDMRMATKSPGAAPDSNVPPDEASSSPAVENLPSKSTDLGHSSSPYPDDGIEQANGTDRSTSKSQSSSRLSSSTSSSSSDVTDSTADQTLPNAYSQRSDSALSSIRSVFGRTEKRDTASSHHHQPSGGGAMSLGKRLVEYVERTQDAAASSAAH